MANKILRLPEVINHTGLSRSTIYQQIADRTFPEPISIGERAVGWIEEEIDQWVQDKTAETRGSSTTGERYER